MALLPKEHGAYGQLIVPLATALIIAGPSAGASLVAVTAVAGFLSHEPAAVLAGSRGSRARREGRREAIIWLTACSTIGFVTALMALQAMPPPTRMWMAAPAVPAAIVAWLTITRRDKTSFGEIAACAALCLTVIPAVTASGASARTGIALAVPFMAMFVATTLAVRAVIARVRGGRDPVVAAAAHRTAFVATTVLTVGVGASIVFGWLPPVTLLAALPGLVAAAVLSAWPPPPTRLRVVGWSLVAVSVCTATIAIAGS
jgi:hypothetical protein